MGRSHLERGDNSDGDGLEHAVPEVLGDVGGSDVAGAEVSAGKITLKVDEDLNPEPGPSKIKRVASEKLRPWPGAPGFISAPLAGRPGPIFDGRVQEGRNPPFDGRVEGRRNPPFDGASREDPTPHHIEQGTTKTKRVASEKMKAALQRARKAKAEKREKVKQSKAISYAPPVFFDIV
jgi:hypothetical protein